MRLNYTSNPPDLDEDDLPILARMLEARGGSGLNEVDLTLLHAPKVADGWHSLFGSIRRQSSLLASIREIAICRVGRLNRAWYELRIHSLILLSCPGFSEEKMAVLRELRPNSKGALNDKEWATLRYTDAMTLNVEVPSELFQEVQKSGFGEREMVELTATIASYNMVTRFLVALDIGEANGEAPQWAR